MSYDAGLVERVRDALTRLGERGTREKNVFSGWGFLLGKNTFVIAWSDGIIAKMAPDEYASALATPGVEAFAPGGERPMGTWVVVSADVVADDPELAEWVEKGLRGVRAAPLEKQRRRPAGRAEGAAKAKRARPKAAKKGGPKRGAGVERASRTATSKAARKSPQRKPAARKGAAGNAAASRQGSKRGAAKRGAAKRGAAKRATGAPRRRS